MRAGASYRSAATLVPRYNRARLTEDADSRSQEHVGSVLNEKWTLERLLGIGGMAAGYAARHRNGARAAVKVLHADLSRHSEVRGRFLREGYAANRVEHPSAVKVMDDDVVVGGPDAGTAYLVKVLRFGLAGLLDGHMITSYGLALGTPSLMSPEQAAGRTDEIDGRTDIFAL